MLQKKLLNLFARATLLSGFLLLANSVSAAEVGEISGIKPFLNSTVARYSAPSLQAYTLALSDVKKVNGVWRIETQRKLNATTTSITYEIAKSVSSQKAYQFFEKQLQNLGVKRLFSCKARACGSSNQWANMVFSEKRLYGPESGQRYLVAELDGAYYVLYVIKRGNKRVYARIDYVQGSSNEKLLSSSGNEMRTSFNRYPLHDNGQLSAVARRWLLSAALKLKKSQQPIWIIAHRYGDQSVEQLQLLAKQDAQLLSDNLQQRGIAASRIQIFSAGPLAPLAINGDLQGRQDRVEIFMFDSAKIL